MIWRDEFSKGLIQLGNFCVLVLILNGVLNPKWNWRFAIAGIVGYFSCLGISYFIGRLGK